MKITYCLLLLMSFLFCTAYVHAQSVQILTVDGKEYTGNVVEEGADTIQVRSEDGIVLHVPRRAIQTINYSYVSGGSSNGGFWSFGGAIGTPAGLNLIVERNFNRDWGIGFAGGYLGELIGLELNLKRRLGGGKSATHSIVFGLGAMELDQYPYDDEWNYIKGAYNLNWGGFHLDVGLSVGSGTFSNPQAMFQIGYVHQFK